MRTKNLVILAAVVIVIGAYIMLVERHRPNSDELEAQADFELNHQILGISPYSAFGGAIGVAEPIRVQLRLSASRNTAASPASPGIPPGSQPAARQ